MEENFRRGITKYKKDEVYAALLAVLQTTEDKQERITRTGKVEFVQPSKDANIGMRILKGRPLTNASGLP